MLPHTPEPHQPTDPPTKTPLTTPSPHHTALNLDPSAPPIDTTARNGTRPDKATSAPGTARRRTGAASDSPTHLPRTRIPNIDTASSSTTKTATQSSTPPKPASPAAPAPAPLRTRPTRDEAAHPAARDAAHVARATARTTRLRDGHCVVGFGTGEGVGVGVSGPWGRAQGWGDAGRAGSRP
ncbi:hypothetical protein B0A49_00689 [Cryomyces minteri]|uniref:Uncharacterized protein n=1 Tax=Cryomyces minteri TaxID=331657 RepID=A0A4V6WLB0_9PEZI|nr:hypothetical protein B0A49_00689 [Cryomyces minteri]